MSDHTAIEPIPATWGTHPDERNLPLEWETPQMVSVGDLFNGDVSEEGIAEAWTVMAATPRHTYRIATRNSHWMRSVVRRIAWRTPTTEERRRGVRGLQAYVQTDERLNDHLGAPRVLGNVQLGVFLQDQADADYRIPDLVDTPAAVRWVKAVDLRNPVDLSLWLPPVSPVLPEHAPTSWEDWPWPEWVPEKVRTLVEAFWGGQSRRAPRNWVEDMYQQGAPAFGSTVVLGRGFGPSPELATGRYVHAWNNIGRLVLADGSTVGTSFSSATRRKQCPLDRVEAGPERWTGAQKWLSVLHDQARAAGVPFVGC